MSKIRTKLSKRHRLKVRKQKLTDRINQCKTVEEVIEFERTLAYYDVLKDDQDWDEGFFFDLIEFKLRRMRDYFWTHEIVENEKHYGDICNTLINILHAGYKTDIILSSDLNMHVNTRNVHRFFNPKSLEFIMREGLQKYYLASVREQKAKKLFWKY